jgi:hypothetical protein
MIAKRYCGSLIIDDKCTLRRTASAEAAKLLGPIVKQGTTKLSKVLWEASKEKVGGAFSCVAGYAKETGNSILSKLGFRKGQEGQFTEIEGVTENTAGPSESEKP